MSIDKLSVEVSYFQGNSITSVIDRIAQANGLRFSSILDVGSSDRPVVEWFRKYKRSKEPRRYTALEIDHVKVEVLRSRNLEVVTDFEAVERGAYDLTLAKEVIEHIKPEDTVDFLKGCESSTASLFALTTPNFEYWRRFRALSDYQECRWIPDHAIDLKPGSANPHHHQQEMTPSVLATYMCEAFSIARWDITIYRAWPWEIRDVSRDRTFSLYFKLFATAVRRR